FSNRDMVGAAAKKAMARRRLRQRKVGKEERWPTIDKEGEEDEEGGCDSRKQVRRRGGCRGLAGGR
ncbi:hypothetical protein BHM03_00059987, partial [Ensete ventricosum]